MEKEYIERETILNLLKKYGIKRGNKVYVIADIGDVIMVIENIPDADVVKVIRCKDCKYCKMVYSLDDEDGIRCIRERFTRLVKDNDYCSYRERRTEREHL